MQRAESAIAGIGMMARGEVALIVTQTAIDAGLPKDFMIMTVLLILLSSILTPILLKVLYAKEKKPPEGGGTPDEEVGGAAVDTSTVSEIVGHPLDAKPDVKK